MKFRFYLSLIIVMMTYMTSQAKTIFPDSNTASNEVDLGVEAIARICPTGMWDHWTFRDINYDRDTNTVFFVIQLNSWDEEGDGAKLTEADAKKQVEWIVSNFKKGYEDLIANPRIMGDGDFMLFLSVGTLLKQMEKDGANLRIMLLKPDYANQVFGDIPLELSSENLWK